MAVPSRYGSNPVRVPPRPHTGYSREFTVNRQTGEVFDGQGCQVTNSRTANQAREDAGVQNPKKR
jgi:hypothetical protein